MFECQMISLLFQKSGDKSPVYIGCYEDQNDRMMEKNMWWYSDTNSPQTCGEACRDYKYFSNQNGGECWCSNTLKREIKKPDSECSKRCPGDNTKFCGAGFRNSVYQREAQGNNYEITRLTIHVNGNPNEFNWILQYFLQPRNAGKNVEKNRVPAITFAGLEAIAVAKVQAGLMEAATERLEELTTTSVLQCVSNWQIWPLIQFFSVWFTDY